MLLDRQKRKVMKTMEMMKMEVMKKKKKNTGVVFFYLIYH
jgi:hypothetical protein